MSEIRPITGARLIEFLGDRALAVRGEPMRLVRGTAPILPGDRDALSFVAASARTSAERLSSTASSVLLVGAEHFTELRCDALMIAVADPRREFARIVAEFFVSEPAAGVHPTAVVSESATIGSGCTIGAGAVIGDDCRIGANTVIALGVIGSHTSIGPNSTIGHVGFGYVREDDGTPLLLPHSGGVRIGSYVDIGANACIDRGTITDTVIRDHAKIDNLVHVAHNCDIGEGAFVIATSILCGSVTIGARAWIAPNVSVLEGVHIGDDAVVGLGSVVIRDVPPGTTIVGNPGRIVARE